MFNDWSESFIKWGEWGLALDAFMESSFFPIPPDFILIPLALATPEKALLFAFLTTLFSVLGALLGYYFGNRFGRPFLSRFAKPETITKVEGMFQKYGTWAVAIAGFTPIPYKVFTIAAGVFKISILKLMIGSIIGRGMRFFGVAFAILWLGDEAKSFLSEYSAIGTVGIALIMILLYLLVKKLPKKNQLIQKN